MWKGPCSRQSASIYICNFSYSWPACSILINGSGEYLQSQSSPHHGASCCGLLVSEFYVISDASSSQALFPPIWDLFTDVAQSWEATQLSCSCRDGGASVCTAFGPLPLLMALRDPCCCSQAGVRFGGGSRVCSGLAINLKPSLVWRVSMQVVWWQIVCGTAVTC